MAELQIGPLPTKNPETVQSGIATHGTRTYHVYMLKRELPVTHCTQCGGAGYNARVTGRRCCKTIAGERCNGINASAPNRADWEDCSFCDATGYYRNKDCPQCQGVGYRFIRPRETQPVA
jgi:DnaJ-class molecular chaperone